MNVELLSDEPAKDIAWRLMLEALTGGKAK